MIYKRLKDEAEKEYISTTYTVHLVEEEDLILTKKQVEEALGSPKDKESKIMGYNLFVVEKLNGYHEIVKDLFVKKECDKACIMNILKPLAKGK